MRVGDTIVARSSPAGRSARALVRLSGPVAHACVRRLAKGGVGGSAPVGQHAHTDPQKLGHPDTPTVRLAEPALTSPPHAGEGEPSAVACGDSSHSAWSARARAVVLEVGRGGAAAAPELPALVAFFHGPRSATGEDVAELLLPGNPVLVERVIAAALGVFPGEVRRAEAGEFTARAFLCGRIDLTQAEGIARLIGARSEAERLEGERLASGRWGGAVRAWSSRLGDLLALTEAGIDFTDQEDVVPIAPGALRGEVDRLRSEIEGLLRSSAGGERREGRPRVVLVGPPNAGKSTLFNALLGRRRAVMSPTPGSTRDVLVETLDLSGDAAGAGEVDLCDVAGLSGPTDAPGGSAEPARESAAGRAARAAALQGVERADVLVLCEPRSSFAPIVELLSGEARAKPRVLVRTKADLVGGVCVSGVTEDGTVLGVCALDGWRLSVLRRAIADAVASLAGGSGAGAEGQVLPRHRAALEEAGEALEATARLIDPVARSLASPELVASMLRRGLDALDQITGRTTPDDILGRVFATFCVGK